MWYFMNQQRNSHKEQMANMLDQRQQIDLTIDQEPLGEIVYELSEEEGPSSSV